jgi:hypothetical protein
VDNLQNAGTARKILEWVTLFLAMLFFILGAGILSGFILGDRIFFQGTMRIVVGLVLMGYGIIRGRMILGRMRWRGKGGEGE